MHPFVTQQIYGESKNWHSLLSQNLPYNEKKNQLDNHSNYYINTN